MKRKTITLVIKQFQHLSKEYTLTESDNGGVIVQDGRSVRIYQSLTEAVAEILAEYIRA